MKLVNIMSILAIGMVLGLILAGVIYQAGG